MRTSEFSEPVAKIERESPPLVRRGAGEWTVAGGWRLSEAPKVKDEGAAVSTPGYSTEGWLRATVPGTVLSTLVDRGVYPDPDYGLNNLAIPETLNKQDYWYRTEFTPPASTAGRRFTLTLNGVNYSAVAWLNGRRLGEVRGAFTRGEFDVTGIVVPGRPNALAVRVSPPPHPGIPHEESLTAGPGENGGAMGLDGPTFICTEGWDWIPGVRDRDDRALAGRDAEGDRRGARRRRSGRHATPSARHDRADVSVTVPLVNDTTRAASGLLEVAFEGVTVRKRVTITSGRDGVETHARRVPTVER